MIYQSNDTYSQLEDVEFIYTYVEEGKEFTQHINVYNPDIEIEQE